MTKKKLPVRFTGQHFTIDKVLIKDAIRQANISKSGYGFRYWGRQGVSYCSFIKNRQQCCCY